MNTKQNVDNKNRDLYADERCKDIIHKVRIIIMNSINNYECPLSREQWLEQGQKCKQHCVPLLRSLLCKLAYEFLVDYKVFFVNWKSSRSKFDQLRVNKARNILTSRSDIKIGFLRTANISQEIRNEIQTRWLQKQQPLIFQAPLFPLSNIKNSKWVNSETVSFGLS